MHPITRPFAQLSIYGNPREIAAKLGIEPDPVPRPENDRWYLTTSLRVDSNVASEHLSYVTRVIESNFEFLANLVQNEGAKISIILTIVPASGFETFRLSAKDLANLSRVPLSLTISFNGQRWVQNRLGEMYKKDLITLEEIVRFHRNFREE